MNATGVNISDDTLTSEEVLLANVRYYEEQAAVFANRVRTLPLHEVYPPFLELLPSAAEILDAGCGTGRDAAAFLARGYAVVAFDASPAMVCRAEKLGVNAQVMTLQNMSCDKHFDGIWACASLLHLPKSEVAGVLECLARVTRDNGVLFVSLKEGDGERFAEDGRFFSYFRLPEFTSLLQAAPWSVIEARRQVATDGRKWLNFLARRISRPFSIS